MFDMTCEKEEIDFDLRIAKATKKAEEKLTLMDLYTKLNKLELENELLKTDNSELQKENIQLRNDNQVLHNKLNENNYNDETLFEGNNPNDEYNEDMLAFAYTLAENDFKFGGHDIKINE